MHSRTAPAYDEGGAGYYQFRTGSEAVSVPMLPDTCASILFACRPDAPDSIFMGIHENAWELTLQPDTVYFGVKPFSTFGLIDGKIAPKELINDTVRLQEIYTSEELEWALANAQTFDRRIAVFQNYFMRFGLMRIT